MTKLMLVRHGETAWNVDLRFQGQHDVPLNQRGWEQARRVAGRLRGEPLAAIYSSDLSRAADTARAIAEPHNLPVCLMPALRERNFGSWEGLSADEARERSGELLDNWRRAPHLIAPPQGESLGQVAARVTEALRCIAARHPNETIVVVGHGGSLRAGILTLLGSPLDRSRPLRLDNASLTVLQFGDGAVDLVTLNDTCHLAVR